LYWLFDKAGYFSTTETFFGFVTYFGVVWTVLNIILLIVWFSWRLPPKSAPEKILVLFAPESQPECEETIFSLYNQFEKDLQGRNLTGVVIRSLVPRSYTIRNHTDADRLLQETGARLVIWGNVERGKLKDKPVEGFKTISFTVRSRELRQQEVLPFAKALGSAMALRAYAYSDSDSFIEKGVVVENLSEVARFFIGAALTLDGKVDDSLPILESLAREVEIKRRQKLRQPQSELFYTCIVEFLKGALIQRFNAIYENSLIDKITLRAADEPAKRCEAVLNTLANLPGDPKEFSLLRAILRFHFGDLKEARRAVNDGKQFLPKTDPAPYLSLGFLRLWEGSYQYALREYMRAKRYMTADTRIIINVIRFFHGVMDANPERQQLRFGLAFVNDWFFDREVAKKEYQLFIEQTESSIEKGIGLVREHARVRLVELGENKGLVVG
jgi:hypothetical protein